MPKRGEHFHVQYNTKRYVKAYTKELKASADGTKCSSDGPDGAEFSLTNLDSASGWTARSKRCVGIH